MLQKRNVTYIMNYCLRPEIAKVDISPFAYIRVSTNENPVVILDEEQKFNDDKMKIFLTLRC
ncbi:PhoH family protein, partial [Erwinia amylovora]|nr:PhoH family protein [Erwinia amylovora]